MQSPPVLTMAEVAALCGVGPRAVERYIRDATDPMPFQTIGRQLRVSLPADFAAWAARRGMLLLGDPHDLARPWPRTEAPGVAHG